MAPAWLVSVFTRLPDIAVWQQHGILKFLYILQLGFSQLLLLS